jgi:hypothetical protein
MATQAQIEANRRNGALSRGPKTIAGKNRSRLNALKHGFAACIVHDPGKPAEIEALARTFESAGAPPALACLIAQAEVERRHIRRYQAGLEALLPLAADASLITTVDPAEIIDKLKKSDRYEVRASARRNQAIRAMIE